MCLSSVHAGLFVGVHDLRDERTVYIADTYRLIFGLHVSRVEMVLSNMDCSIHRWGYVTTWLLHIASRAKFEVTKSEYKVCTGLRSLQSLVRRKRDVVVGQTLRWKVETRRYV